MKRSKKIVLVSHCVLNVNSKVEGLSQSPGAVRNIIDVILDRGFSIMQLPCPEHIALGIKRWGQAVSQYDNPFYNEHCKKIAHSTMMEVKDYIDNGYEVKCVIGMDGSPTCGVSQTFIGENVGGIETVDFSDFKIGKGQGILMKQLKQEALDMNIDIAFLGLNELNPSESEKELIEILEK